MGLINYYNSNKSKKLENIRIINYVYKRDGSSLNSFVTVILKSFHPLYDWKGFGYLWNIWTIVFLSLFGCFPLFLEVLDDWIPCNVAHLKRSIYGQIEQYNVSCC